MKILVGSLVIVLVGIAYLSITPTEVISIGNDKLGHVLAYTCLMLNLGLLTYSHRKNFIKAIGFALFYGASMEIIQYFVPGRFMSLFDMFANALGVLLGVIVIRLFYKQLRTFFNGLGLKI